MNDWDQWRHHILAEMKRLGDQNNDLKDSLQALHIDLAGLKVQARIWGATAGVIPGIILGIIQYLLERGGH